MTTGLKKVSISQRPPAKKAQIDPKYKLGRQLLIRIEKSGAFKTLPKSTAFTKGPTIIENKASDEKAAAARGGGDSARGAPPKPEVRSQAKTASKAVPSQKGGPKDLKNATNRK